MSTGGLDVVCICALVAMWARGVPALECRCEDPPAPGACHLPGRGRRCRGTLKERWVSNAFAPFPSAEIRWHLHGE